MTIAPGLYVGSELIKAAATGEAPIKAHKSGLELVKILDEKITKLFPFASKEVKDFIWAVSKGGSIKSTEGRSILETSYEGGMGTVISKISVIEISNSLKGDITLAQALGEIQM